jgi:hypothetical protein
MAEVAYPNWPTTDRPDALQIYELERPVVNERSLRQLASTFGLRAGAKDGRILSDAQKISYAVGSHVVTTYRASGALRYQDSSRWQVDDGTSDMRMAEDEAVAIAQRYIGTAGIAPLAECQLAAVTRLRVGVANIEGEELEERVIDMGVIFHRVVDGTPVDGPGGKVIVYLDARGDVTGVDRTWRTIGDVRRSVEALRPADEVMQRVRRFWGGSVQLEVSQVRFGYFEQGFRTPQRILQPAYVVMVTLRVEDQEQSRRAVYVQAAATNSLGVLQPARSKRPPQTSRPKGQDGPRY